MTHDLMDAFIVRFPHLASHATRVAQDIATAEELLDDATAEGLVHVRFAWLALREVQIDIDEHQAAQWLNFLSKRGFRSMVASCKPGGGAVALHLMRTGHPGEEASRICLQMPQPQRVAA